MIERVLKRRFVVTLADSQGVFSGVLTDFGPELWVFEECATVPSATDASPEQIAGRVFIERINVSYLQEITA